MPDSTRTSKTRKADTGRPKKPFEGFPLYAHTLGYWSKKVGGKIRHFGRWGRVRKGTMTPLPPGEFEDAWKDALVQFNREFSDLKAGRMPHETKEPVGEPLKDVCNVFLTSKLRAMEAGEIGQRMFDEYKATSDRVIAHFGGERYAADLRPADFASLKVELASQYGPTRRANEIQKIRTLFKWAYEIELLDRPARFGPDFKKPPARIMRKRRNERGSRMIEPERLRELIETAPIPLKAMILLGINCAYGNHDVATVPLSSVNLQSGWIDFARPKSGIKRRCPLWPETIAALLESLARRPTPKETVAEGLVFVTARGRAWLSRGIANPVSVAARKHGIKFYDLRHCFRTVADSTKDHPAIRLIMGHTDGAIDDTYRESIDDNRLVAVADYVRSWLFVIEEVRDGTRAFI